jgi:inorganic pyrophosphatase/exopolyphosphatase
MEENYIDANSYSYLKMLRHLFSSSNNISEITFIIGNNTCDLDSAICSYLLSLALNIQEKTIIIDYENGQNVKINMNTKKLCLPVLNIERGTLPYRIDVKYVFDKYNIDCNDFWYITDDCLTKEKLFQYPNNFNCKNIVSNIILVDHNLLIEELRYLSNYVIDIYDHHLMNGNNNIYPNLKSTNVKLPIGSCTTIILSKFFLNKFPSKILNPLFSLTALIIDCRNFSEDYYGNRWVDLDREVFYKIESEIKEGINMDEYYKEINGIKSDVDKNLMFGFEPLLKKVQKYYNFNGYNIIWSAFYISFFDIQKKIGDDEIIDNMLKYYKTDEDIKKTFFVTNSTVDSNKELYTVFHPIRIPVIFDDFQAEVEKENKHYFYSLEKKTYKDKDGNLKGIMHFYVVNYFYTRKQAEPIFEKICSKLPKI